MNSRILAAAALFVILLGLGGGALWWTHPAPEPEAVDLGTDDLPIPPFPPRIAEGPQYDECMTMLIDDPEGAEEMASSWQASGGGDAALHCQALAMIANGDAEAGAETLENLAHGGKVEGLTKVVLLSQAADARIMAEQHQSAVIDTTEALAISPDDPDLLISRATANDALGKQKDAMEDLNQALALDETRGEALILRGSIWRRMDMLTEAKSDIDKAVAIDPDDPDALLERGILRQRAGDLAGAREDWIRARDLDPDSDTAELAAQNLTLLDAGPKK